MPTWLAHAITAWSCDILASATHCWLTWLHTIVCVPTQTDGSGRNELKLEVVGAGVGCQITLLQNLLAYVATVALGIDSPVDDQLTMHET